MLALATKAGLACLVWWGEPFVAQAASSTYSFLAEREECDGQCTYCRHAHHQHNWTEIRRFVSNYVYSTKSWSDPAAWAVHVHIQNLIDWSWERGARYECIIGIISLRMLSYGYSDPFQFSSSDADTMDFLDTFNRNTGALDLLTSSWPHVLAGGWPIFRELLLVARKVKDRLEGPSELPQIQARGNECDVHDSEDDREYQRYVRRSLDESGSCPPVGVSLVNLRRRPECPMGISVGLLCVALDLVQNQGLYQGSLKDTTNVVHALVLAAQDAFAMWAKSFPSWVPFFDLLSTRWPLLDVLSHIACVSSARACVTRSALQCYDFVRREFVLCPYFEPKLQISFAGCGEHDICTWPPGLPRPKDWCLPFDLSPSAPELPFLFELSHDEELRVCSQCGQDGLLRAIFERIGFRPAARKGLAAPYYVEFGARKPGMLNSAVLREYCEWDGLLMDGQPGETPHGGCPGCPGVTDVRVEFVTAANIVSLFQKHGVPHDFDLLTIDVDFNDYWIWRALLEDGTFRPRVVAVDFNPDLPLNAALVVRYDESAEWDGSRYTVGSLLAYALMAHAHDYHFAYALEMGSHAFFIRGDLLHMEDHSLPLRAVRKMSHPPDLLGREFQDVLYDFMPANSSALQCSSRDAARDADPAKEKEVFELQAQVRALTSEVRALTEALAQRPGSGNFAAGGGAGRSQATPATAASDFYDEVRRLRQAESIGD